MFNLPILARSEAVSSPFSQAGSKKFAAKIKLLSAAVCTLGLLLSAPQANATTIGFVDNIAGTFTDISGTGTALNLTDDGGVSLGSSVSNLVFSAGIIRIGSNGGVRFDGTDEASNVTLAFNNLTIPTTEAFGGDQTLLPFWDDIDTDSGNAGNIFVETISDVLIVQWDDVEFFDSNDTVTFQLKVFGAGSPALAQFLYIDIEDARANGGGSATIGYQTGNSGFNDVQFSFNNAGVVSNGTVLSLVEISSVSEPGTFALLGIGLVGLGVMRRRRKMT